MKRFKKQSLSFLILAAQSMLLISAPSTPKGHRRFEKDDLRFHKPSINGVTYWKLVPNESQFNASHKVVAQILNGKKLEKTVTITSLADATQLLEQAIQEGTTVEWYCTTE